ncbi:hypothetical protein CspeluHIS016_0503210 [Cutaneotrichosporon spelunceum]|uniref:Uncharacterized protein n=1 Tax=Cutaneotrichosporon spelunceum TaxID=1672016 RepID=A0AAD3TWT9_9TREE|nr:hypothetical protein CspeluHIS016_0503210 [Cutaneotrichosporon spelunceum]
MLPFAYVLPQSEIWALRAALAGPDPSPQSIAESFQWNTASPSTEGYKEGTNSEEGTNDEEVKKLEASEEDEDVILFSRIENRQQQIVDNYYELQGRLRDKDIDLAKARNDSERESQEKSEEIHCLQRQLKSTMLQFQDNVCQSEKMSSDLSASMDVNASLLAQVATLEAEVARLAKSLTEDRHAEQVSHDQMKVIECPKCESRHVSHCPCCKAGTRFLPPGPIRSPTGSIRRSSNRKARTSAAIPKWKLRSLRLSRQGRLSAQGLFPPTKAGGVRKSPESSNEVHGVPTTESHIPALQVIDASMEVEAEWPAAVDSNNLHLYRQPVPSNPWADAFFLSGREDLMKSGGHHCMADALVHGEIGDRAQVQSMEWEQATAVEPTGQPPLMTHAAVDAVRNGHNGQVIERGIAANGMGLQTVPLVDATDSGLTASWAAVLAEARHNNLDVRKVILNGARNGDPQAQVALVHLALPLDRPNYHDSFALLVLRGLVDGCDLVQEAVIALGRRATVGGRTYPVEALRKMRRKGHPFATQILAQLSIPAPFAPPPQLILAPVPAPTSVSGPLPTCPIVHDTLACSHGQNNAPDIDCGNVPVPAPSQLGEATAH